MTIPLLETKLYIPAFRPGLVLRPRLIERLNAGLQRKLTFISAPPGFGKTTLLSEWISHSGLRNSDSGLTATSPHTVRNQLSDIRRWQSFPEYSREQTSGTMPTSWSFVRVRER